MSVKQAHNLQHLYYVSVFLIQNGTWKESVHFKGNYETRLMWVLTDPNVNTIPPLNIHVWCDCKQDITNEVKIYFKNRDVI